MESNPKVLVLTSVPLAVGPAKMAEDVLRGFLSIGIEADLLLPYKDETHPEYLYIYEKESIRTSIKRKLFNVFLRKKEQSKHSISYHSECKPPFPVKDVLAAIKKKYNYVIVVFWQGAFTFKTVLAIHEKLNCVIRFSNVDYSTMSGGCHFAGNCTNYQSGCGNCPVYRFPFMDYTKANVLYKEKVKDIVKPIMSMSQYMYDVYYSKSKLWHDYDRIDFSRGPIIDLNVFKPLDKESSRNKLNISVDKFLILIGCQQLDDPRKGIGLLIEALRILHNKLSETERKQVEIVAIGRNFQSIQCNIPFKSYDLGYRPISELPYVYSAASCYVCPSIYDAGPMMVNQSLCCGTPVVGFDMGAVKLVVKNQGTGYCAKLKDVNDLAYGIEYMFRLSDKQMLEIGERCRQVSSGISSYEAKARHSMDAFYKYRKEL